MGRGGWRITWPLCDVKVLCGTLLTNKELQRNRDGAGDQPCLESHVVGTSWKQQE